MVKVVSMIILVELPNGFERRHKSYISNFSLEQVDLKLHLMPDCKTCSNFVLRPHFT